MTSIKIKSNFLFITNINNYELTLIININNIEMIYFNPESKKGVLKDLVFRLKGGIEKTIPFEDEDSAEIFVSKLIECFD